MNTNLLRKAVDIIKKGGLVIFPTDTVYGLGCNPFNEKALGRLFQVKKRVSNKPVPILVSSLKKAEEIAEFSSFAKKIASQYWPGALTLVLPAKPKVPPSLLGRGDSVGIRIPNHQLTLLLIRGVGGYLIGTSANLSGRKPACTSEEAGEQLGEKVDMILDGGRCPIGNSSTVVDVISSPPRILRQGTLELKIE